MMKKTSAKELDLYTVLVRWSLCLRLVSAPLIFASPLFATSITFLLDGVDGELYKRAGYARPRYSLYDKILDYYWYLFVLAFILVANVPQKPLFIALFVYRTIGQAIFFITRKGFVLFAFPNVFELLFFYYLYASGTDQVNGLMYGNPLMIALASMTTFAVVREYALHVQQTNFSGLWTGAKTFWPKTTINNYKVMGLFAFLLMMAASYSYLRNSQVTYENRAGQAERSGGAIAYNPEGSITGWINSKEKLSGTAWIYNTGNLRKPVCEAPVKLVDSAVQSGELWMYRRLFTIQSGCLANLPDGSYRLIVTLGRKSFIMDFNLGDGLLTR